MPEQISMALQVFPGEFELNDVIAAVAKPFDVEVNFFVAGGVAHAARYDKSPKDSAIPHEDLVSRKHHILKSLHGIYDLNL